jgi:hypothetical protein
MPNAEAGLPTLLPVLVAQAPGLIVLEATGGYERSRPRPWRCGDGAGRYRGRDETTPPILEALDVRLTRLEQATLKATASIDRLEARHSGLPRDCLREPQPSTKSPGRPSHALMPPRTHSS